MMKAPPGLFAGYRYKGEFAKARTVALLGDSIDVPDGDYISVDEPIVGWDDNGDPLVVRERGVLERPHPDGFVGILDKRDEHIIQLIPADGWLVWSIDDTGDPWSRTLAGWGLTASGSMAPLDTDDDGLVEILTLNSARLFGSVLRHRSEGAPGDWVAEQRRMLREREAKQQASSPAPDPADKVDG